MRTLLTLADIERLHGQYESRTLDMKAAPPHTNRLVQLIQSGANGVAEVFRIVIGAAEDANGRFDKSSLALLRYPIQPEGMGQSFGSFDKFRQHVIASVRSGTSEYFEGMFEIREIEATDGVLIIIEVAQSEHRPHQNKQNQRYYIRADGETRPMDDFEVAAEIVKRQQRRVLAMAPLAGGPPSGEEPSWLTTGHGVSSTPVQYVDGFGPGQIIATPSDETGAERQIRISGTASMWLRLEPSMLRKYWTNTQLCKLIGPPAPALGPLLPYRNTLRWDRNGSGAIVWDEDRPGITMSATQLKHHGQIWGIDTRLLEPEHLKLNAKTQFAFIPSAGMEKILENALSNYLTFAQDKLEIPLPYTLSVGISGVQGYRLAYNDTFEGKMIQPSIATSIGIESVSTLTSVILLPFFQAVWDACGLSRPDDFQTVP